VVFALVSSTEAQQEKKTYRVGFLAPGASLTRADEAFRVARIAWKIFKTIKEPRATWL
jgi:hypothetical protein